MAIEKTTADKTFRTLVIDDNQAIHQDIRKLLVPDDGTDARLGKLEADLFGKAPRGRVPRYRVDSAFQGAEGLEFVRRALSEGDPYAVALVDVRMPPGWDGIETIARIWPESPELQVIICTAYSDYQWTEIVDRLGYSDNLLILKKPFDPVELQQMVNALTRKWWLQRVQRENREKLQQANEELQRANALLGHKSAQLELNIEKLRVAQDQLIQAGKLAAIGQLSAYIAHEVNNPLTVILGYAQGLDSRLTEEDPLRPGVSSIKEEAIRCKKVVQELLLFSRTGKKTLEIINLNELVRSTTVLLATKARAQGVDIVQELAEKELLLEANKTEIQQVMVNLGTNAIDAMKSGGVITIRTGQNGQGEAYFEVADTGMGIPETLRPRIFEPFFTTKEIGKGTGLGLSLVHEIVRQHGGKIDLDTQVQKGTTMRVWLPTGTSRGNGS